MPNANLIDRFLRGSRLHEHADPEQRAAGASLLPPEAAELTVLLGDPAPQVRAAAAGRCRIAPALASALAGETEPTVRAALAASLGEAVATVRDADAVRALLTAPECGDAVRAQVARRACDDDVRRAAIDAIVDENVLVEVALEADHSAVRLAAAERVHAQEPLARLLDGARDKDRGVARIARERLQDVTRRIADAEAADRLLADAEALVDQPGAIVMAAVEIDRRWRTLALGDEADRRARWDDVNRRLRERFEREREDERRRTQFDRRVNAWIAALGAPELTAAALPALRAELAALRSEADGLVDLAADERVQRAELNLARWEEAAPGLAAAEALVAEAEQLAAATTIDDAELPARWQALDPESRTPVLSERLQAALRVIEQRRTAVARAHQDEQGSARQELHAALHLAEQAVAAGHVQDARSAADRVRLLKLHAGRLPAPTVQRLSRMLNQLVELERWQQFGQQGARVQLCERAEAAASKALAPADLAREVQQLRAEWKTLDAQQPGVPKALWERFDAACERAYAPAARHFAEVAARTKEARRQREGFIAAAAERSTALLGTAPDWRALERWLRDTETAWRDKALGSVDPGLWKKLDARLKQALAPVQTALRAARGQAIREREALIAEAQAVVAKAAERDAPARVKELQSRWQAHAKSIVLPQRDERALWERFRGACQAVFEARAGQRRETDDRRTAQRRRFETLCERVEELARDADREEGGVRQARQELQQAWRATVQEVGPAPGATETRFRAALARVDQALRARGRRSEAAAYGALLAKERLCSDLDGLALGAQDAADANVDAVRHRWAALPPLAPDWEGALAGRRDAALDALADADARYDHAARIRAGADARRDALLELEMMLGIDSPAELKAARLAVQVRELRDRFKRTAPSGVTSAPEVLVRWCALPGTADARERARVEAIVERIVGG